MTSFMQRLHGYHERVRIIPFQTMFALFCVWSGIAGILQFGIASDVFARTVGQTVSLTFNTGYVLAGLGMLIGIATNRKNIEAFGLVLVVTSIIIRQMVLGTVLGLSSQIVGSYVFSLLFIGACAERMVSIVRKRSTPLLVSEYPLTTIVLANKQGNIVRWDTNAEALFGYTKAEIEGHSLTEIMPERYRENHGRSITSLAQGAEPTLFGKPMAVEALHKDGHEFPILITLNNWKLGDSEFYSGTISKR